MTSAKGSRESTCAGICRGGLCLFLLGAAVSWAQLPTATILGLVRDTTGAVVPGTSLTARNVETGLVRSTVSAEDGSYRFAAMPVGSYEVRVEHAGFQTAVRSGLTLTVGQEAVVNFTLEIGTVEQTIAVTAEAPLVDTTTGVLGGLVNEQRVVDLPLNGRNYINLSLLQTGVQRTSVRAGGPIMRGMWISSNGGTGRSNYYMLDGAALQNLDGNSPLGSVSDSSLGVEGIREFRMVTNSFSAEYGMAMGSQMVIVSKSGTNSFHGSAFEFLRNSALDARNFFDRKTATTPRRLPAFTRNNFGGAIGGPLRKDQTFFHAVYEGLRERLGLSSVDATIPASAKVDGGLVPQISPVTRPFLQFFPDPNLAGNLFTYPNPRTDTENYGQTRVDHSFSSNDTLFGRYTIADTVQTFLRNYGRTLETRQNRGQFATLSETHIFSPVLLNTLRFSYSRTRIFSISPTGIIGPQFSFVPGIETGSFSIGGLPGWGASGTSPIHHKQNIFTWSDDVFYTLGKHSLKFGTLINRFRMYNTSSINLWGAVTFGDIASFLRGGPVVGYVAITPGSTTDRQYQVTTLGFYFQDDFRVTSNLTLNLGIRYEPTTTVSVEDGREFVLRDLLRDTKTTQGPPFSNMSLGNLGPRFGFAWDIGGNGKTAVRGGFGVLYDVVGYGGALLSHNNVPLAGQSSVANVPTLTLPLVFPPESQGKTLRQIDFDTEQPHMLHYNVTVERQLPLSMALRLSYVGTRGINLFQRYDANPTLPQIQPDGRRFWTGNELRMNPNWDFIGLRSGSANSWYNSLQFEVNKRLSRGLQFQSAYTFSRAIDTNPGQISGDSQDKVPDSNNRAMDKAVSEFHTPHNWRFNAIYRFPELISSGGAAAKLLNGWWISGILSLNSGYPFSPSVQGDRARSKINIGGLGPLGQRPDLVPGIAAGEITEGVSRGCGNIPAGTPVGGPELYFDPCAFRVQPAGFQGTTGRNILRDRGEATLDFSLMKDTTLGFLGESGKLEFRAEFFNILNHVNFDRPAFVTFAGRADGEAPLGNAGRITATRGTSRQVQLALKLIF